MFHLECGDEFVAGGTDKLVNAVTHLGYREGFAGVDQHGRTVGGDVAGTAHAHAPHAQVIAVAEGMVFVGVLLADIFPIMLITKHLENSMKKKLKL